MKPSTMAFITAATVLAAVACAKKEHKSPLEKPNPSVDSPAEQDAARAHAVALAAAGGKEMTFIGKNNHPALPGDATSPGNSRPVDYALTETYKGDIITLAYPDEASLGWIHLDDEDARAVYNTLRVKTAPIVENKVYTAGVTKTGLNIRCFEAAEKKTPKVPAYACAIYMNYKTGEVQTIPLRLEQDAKVPVLSQKFTGQYVTMIPANSELPAVDPVQMAAQVNSNGTALLSATGAHVQNNTPYGKIEFSGNDARALFSTLEVEAEADMDERAAGTVLRKKAQNVICKKTQSDGAKEATFACRLVFNPTTGAISTIKKGPSAGSPSSTGSSSTSGSSSKPNLNPANGMGSANPVSTKSENHDEAKDDAVTGSPSETKPLPFENEAPPEL